MTHGYQFLYFNSRGREAISAIRAGFTVLSLVQSRIIDIHYPRNTTIGFLVHNDYATNVIEAMAKLPGATHRSEFDPCDPPTLKDLKYVAQSVPEFLKAEALRIHKERLIGLIQRLPAKRLQLAIARDFFKSEWISESVYKHLLSEISHPKDSKKASSPSTDINNAMADAPASQTAASSTSISPADGVSAPMV